MLDALPLLADGQARVRIKSVVGEQLRAWADGLGEERPDEVVLLWPGGPSDRSTQFAKLVGEVVREWDGAPTFGGEYPVERVVRAGRNVLAAPNEGLAPSTAALVVDWGAVTLHTTQELIHIAADLGASSVLAIILSSQLAPEDELAASHVRAVSGRKPHDERVQGQLPLQPDAGTMRQVPAEIRFLSSFAVGYALAAECSLCGLARDYVRLSETAPSFHLSEHARAVARSLEPLDLVHSRRNGPRDALGGQLLAAEAADVVAVRQRLATAQLSTEARLALVEDLGAPRASMLDAIVRALGLEPRWLKSAPLRFIAARLALAEALTQRMADGDFATAAPTLRRQYVLVLRATSKSRFLQAFPDLLRSALGRGDLAVGNDLLLGAHSLASRPYHENPRSRARMTEALARAGERLRDDADAGASPAGLSAREAIRNMLAQLDFAGGRQRDAALTTREAWLRLREDYWHTIREHHHDLAISSIEGALRLQTVRAPGMWELDAEDFGRIQRYLASKVLPRLGPVADVLEGWFTDHDPSGRYVRQLRRLLADDGISELAGLGNLMSAFAADPMLAQVRRDEALAQIDWWWGFFFGRDSDGLLTALGECPCDVVGALAAGVMAGQRVAERAILGVDLRTVGSDFKAFCHPRVVAAVGHHLVVNAGQRKHAVAGLETAPVSIDVAVRRRSERVDIVVRNDGTDPTAGPTGHGLRTLSDRLKPYGAQLSVLGADEPWTYAVKVSIPRL
jgi:hypothetical protein